MAYAAKYSTSQSRCNCFLRPFSRQEKQVPPERSISPRKESRKVSEIPPRRSRRPRSDPFSAFPGRALWFPPSARAGPPDPSDAGRAAAVCASSLFFPLLAQPLHLAYGETLAKRDLENRHE